MCMHIHVWKYPPCAAPPTHGPRLESARTCAAACARAPPRGAACRCGVRHAAREQRQVPAALRVGVPLCAEVGEYCRVPLGYPLSPARPSVSAFTRTRKVSLCTRSARQPTAVRRLRAEVLLGTRRVPDDALGAFEPAAARAVVGRGPSARAPCAAPFCCAPSAAISKRGLYKRRGYSQDAHRILTGYSRSHRKTSNATADPTRPGPALGMAATRACRRPRRGSRGSRPSPPESSIVRHCRQRRATSDRVCPLLSSRVPSG